LSTHMPLINNNTFTIESGTVSLNGNILSTGGHVVVTGASSVLQCNGGCGAGTACNQGADLLCGNLNVNSGGTVTP
jgi:hypothetical protein